MAAGCARPAQVPRSASGTPGCVRVNPRTCSSYTIVSPHGTRGRAAGDARRRRGDDGLRDERRAVRVVAHAVVRAGAEHRGVQRERAIERARVGIDEELRRIEAVAVARVVRAVRAQTVAVARGDPGHEAVEDVAGALGQRDARALGRSRRVEQAQFDGRRVRRHHRDVRAVARERHAERLGASGAGARIGQIRRCAASPR